MNKFVKKVGHAVRRLPLRHRHFTIVANNCWGGLLYQYLGMAYESPTVGLVIPPDDYVRFCKGFADYIKLEVEPLSIDDARHQKLFRKLNEVHGDLVYGKVGDIEICFLHYKTFEIAKEKWERRSKRVNLNYVIYKNNDHNYITEEDFEAWNEFASSKNTLFITCKKDWASASKAKMTMFNEERLPDFPEWVCDVSRKMSHAARWVNTLLKKSAKQSAKN